MQTVGGRIWPGEIPRIYEHAKRNGCPNIAKLCKTAMGGDEKRAYAAWERLSELLGDKDEVT